MDPGAQLPFHVHALELGLHRGPAQSDHERHHLPDDHEESGPGEPICGLLGDTSGHVEGEQRPREQAGGRRAGTSGQAANRAAAYSTGNLRPVEGPQHRHPRRGRRPATTMPARQPPRPTPPAPTSATMHSVSRAWPIFNPRGPTGRAAQAIRGHRLTRIDCPDEDLKLAVQDRSACPGSFMLTTRAAEKKQNPRIRGAFVTGRRRDSNPRPPVTTIAPEQSTANDDERTQPCGIPASRLGARRRGSPRAGLRSPCERVASFTGSRSRLAVEGLDLRWLRKCRRGPAGDGGSRTRVHVVRRPCPPRLLAAGRYSADAPGAEAQSPVGRGRPLQPQPQAL